MSLAFLRNADAHLENGSDYDSDDGCSTVRFFPIVLVPEVDKCLRSANNWQFNAFLLKDATNDAPLSTLCFWLLQTTGLVREFGEWCNLCQLTFFATCASSHFCTLLSRSCTACCHCLLLSSVLRTLLPHQAMLAGEAADAD